MIGIVSSFIATELQMLVSLHFFRAVFLPKKKASVQLLVGFLLFSICALQNVFYNFLPLNCAMFFSACLALSLICFSGGALRSILSAAFLLFALEVSRLTVELFLIIFGLTVDVENNLSFALYLSAVVLVYMIVPEVSAVTLRKYRHEQQERLPAFLIIEMLISMLCLFIIKELCEMIELSVPLSVSIGAVTVMIPVSVILSYVFHKKAAAAESERRSLREEVRSAEIVNRHNEIILRQNEELHRLIHDEKKHLEVISGLTDEERVKEYIRSVSVDIITVPAFGNTKNRVLDLIISKYSLLCSEKGIRFTANFMSSNLSFIDENDLTSLLGNILDNALEAAEKSKEKKIELTCNFVNGFQALTCINSCVQEPLFDGEFPITSKDNGAFHGNGVKIIRKISDKYGAALSFEYNAEKKEFEVDVIFR